MPTTPSSKYRPEIDGLRAFAVVAVIINHFNKDLLPSGYLGVDIFFVISGYVITSSLAGRESKNFLDFLTGFYERRIKRLVPALVVFVLITSILISLFNPDPGVALGLGWKSLFGVSNISLYRSSTDYFAQSTELNPFTHTWSLGVEEQFYLLFPFLIWFSGFGQQTAKGARNLFLLVGAMTIASLLGFIYLYQVNQPAAYFLMPPRFWEMAAGCLIFIGFQKRAKIEQALEQVPPLPVVLAMVGVMFLPVSAAVPATIGIVVLSAILIACLKEGTSAYDFFTLEKVVYVGLISYSLYLWHWSVLCISRWTIGIHWWSVPIQVGVILLLATGSYRFIETRFRKNAFANRRQIIGSGLGVLFFSALLLTGVSKQNRFSIYLGDTSKIPEERFEHRFTDGAITSKQCLDFDSVVAATMICQENYDREENKQTYWLVGDSHAISLLRGFRKLAIAESKVLRVVTRRATAFPQPKEIRALGPYPEKDMVNRMNSFIALEKIMLKQVHPGDVVFIAQRFPFHFGPDLYEYQLDKFFYKRNNQVVKYDKRQYFIEWLKSLELFALKMQGNGAKVVILGGIPEWKAAKDKNCKGQKRLWFQSLQGENCNSPKELWNSLYGWHNELLRQLPAKQKNVYVFNSLDAVCPRGRCGLYDDSRKSLYWDDDHLSDYASTTFIEPALRNFTLIGK